MDRLFQVEPNPNGQIRVTDEINNGGLGSFIGWHRLADYITEKLQTNADERIDRIVVSKAGLEVYWKTETK